MLRRWYSTVAGLRNSCAATSRLVSPSATRRAIWASWDVSALVVSTLRVPAPFTDPLGGLLQPGRVPGQLPGKTGYQHFALRSATSWAGPVAVAGGIAVINDPVAHVPRFSRRFSLGLAGGGPGLSDLRVGRGGNLEQIQYLQLELGEPGFEDLDERPG